MDKEELIKKLQIASNLLQKPDELYRQKEDSYEKARALYNSPLPAPTKRTIVFGLGALGSLMYFWTDSRTIGYLLLGIFCIIALLWTSSSYKSDKQTIANNIAEFNQHGNKLEKKYWTMLNQAEATGELAFLPREFWFLDAVNFFEKALRTERADTLKEAIRLFDQFLERQENAYMQAERNELLRIQNKKLDNIETELEYANFYGNR